MSDAASATASAATTLSVAQAVAVASRGIRLAAPVALWVQGEVSGLVNSRAGNWYWSLSDEGSRLSVCALRRDAAVIADVLRDAGVSLADGLTVRVYGRLGVYSPRGQLQMQVSAVDPVVSVGAGVLARRQVRARLAAEDMAGRQCRLRPAPCPLRVGVVAPPGRGLADFLAVLNASPWAWQVRVVTVSSEGPDAPHGIAAAIARLARADLVVVTRGGGSGVTAVYDTFQVAAAVCTSPVPVLVAVGHHGDASVADECAWRSVSTPTAAGTVCCDLLQAADTAVSDVGRVIAAAGRRRLEEAAGKLAALEAEVNTARERLVAARATADRLAAARSARRARAAAVAVVVLAVLVVVLILFR